MKKKLLIILSCLLALTLSACSVNINTGDGQSAGTSAPDASGSAAPTETEEVVEQDAFTNAQGAVIAPNAKGIRVSRALRIYEEAAQRIKTEAIGFSRTHWQDFNDINAIDSTGIADFVLTIVSKNTVPNNSAQEAAQNPQTFASGDAASIRENFPLFGFDSVYVESENNDYIAGAEYIETDNYREYYIYFRDALNPKTGTAGFGGLMTPFDREEVLDGIRLGLHRCGFVLVADILGLAGKEEGRILPAEVERAYFVLPAQFSEKIGVELGYSSPEGVETGQYRDFQAIPFVMPWTSHMRR